MIGTAGTIKSGAYERAIRALDPRRRRDARARVRSSCRSSRRAGLEHAATRLIARRVPRARSSSDGHRHARAGLHALSAAQAVARATCSGEDVRLIDSAEETAAETARTLAGARTRGAAERREPTYRFVASDDPLQFLQLGQRFLGDDDRGRRDPHSRLSRPSARSAIASSVIAKKRRRIEPRAGVGVHGAATAARSSAATCE